jgi:hypothetical protein
VAERSLWKYGNDIAGKCVKAGTWLLFATVLEAQAACCSASTVSSLTVRNANVSGEYLTMDEIFSFLIVRNSGEQPALVV